MKQKVKTISFLTLITVLSLLEILAFGAKGGWERAAAFLWAAIGISLASFFIICIFRQIFLDALDRRKFWIDVAFLVLLFPFFYTLGNLQFCDVNPDAAQQVMAGIEAIGTKGIGYTKNNAFIGYSCRQYVIAALPSVLFGRSIFALALGFGFPFLLGVTAFFGAIRKQLAAKGYPEWLALFPIVMLSAFPFLTEYYMNFEQAIIPITLVLFTLAMFLRTGESDWIVNWIALMWLIGMMNNSYTPSLAALGLLCAGLLLRAFFLLREKADHLQVAVWHFACVYYAVITFVATSLGKRADRLSRTRQKIGNPVTYLIRVFERSFLEEGLQFWGIFLALVVAYIIASFLGLLTIWDILCSVWILGVILFADYLIGYSDYEKIWNLQRLLVAVPVIILCLFNRALYLFRNRTVRKRVLAACLAVFFLVGISNFGQPHRSFRYFSYTQPMKYIIHWMTETEPVDGDILLLTRNPLMQNAKDYRYYFPEGSTLRASAIDKYDGFADYPVIFSDELLEAKLVMGYQMEIREYRNVRYNTVTTVYRYTKIK